MNGIVIQKSNRATLNQYLINLVYPGLNPRNLLATGTVITTTRDIFYLTDLLNKSVFNLPSNNKSAYLFCYNWLFNNTSKTELLFTEKL